jgi:glycosyltransferase involved in cell wall biosynthesis
MATIKTGSPRVSIGLPVYNGERYLAETIEAISAQTFSDFELIISDNASTDRTQEICESRAACDPRVRYIRHEINQGANWNFSYVVEMARGVYFRWASADDLFAPESLSCCVEVLDRFPDVVLCYPKTVLIDASGQVIRPYDDRLDLQSNSPVDRFLMASKRIGLVNVLYGLMRSKDVRKTKLIRHYPGADITFVLELTLYGKFLEIDRPLFFRRMHDQASSSMKSSPSKLQAYLAPSGEKQHFSPRLQALSDKVVRVLRGPLSIAERFQLLYFLVGGMVYSYLVLIPQAVMKRHREL